MAIDTSEVLVISAIISPLLTAALVWVNQKNAKKAEAKADEVKVALANTNHTVANNLAEIVATGNNTHTLVNSQMGRALLMASTTLRALANLTHDPAIEVAAKNAETELADHRAKQAALDANLAKGRM